MFEIPVEAFEYIDEFEMGQPAGLELEEEYRRRTYGRSGYRSRPRRSMRPRSRRRRRPRPYRWPRPPLWPEEPTPVPSSEPAPPQGRLDSPSEEPSATAKAYALR